MDNTFGLMEMITLNTLRKRVDEVSIKHKVTVFDILHYSINQYVDLKTGDIFYHDANCACLDTSCEMCGPCITAGSHKELHKHNDRRTQTTYLTRLQARLYSPCSMCIWAGSVFNAQSEVFYHYNQLFPDLSLDTWTVGVDKTWVTDVLLYSFGKQKQLSTIFNGYPVVQITGAMLCEETAKDVIYFYRDFEHMSV